MIKLIASDIDGTLLREGTVEIDSKLFQIIKKLKAKGIQFVVASGRPYASMLAVFEPVKQDVIFIAENGALVMEQDQVMSLIVPDQDRAKELIQEARTLPDCNFYVSGVRKAYTESTDSEFIDWLTNGYHYDLVVLEDILKMPEEMIKVSIHCKSGAESIWKRLDMEKWKQHFACLLSGECWLDFAGVSAEKGSELAKIQEKLQITKEETAAFGDNLNDIGMLKLATYSYAVANAKEEVKEAAAFLTKSCEENGVLEILEQMAE